MSCRRKDISMRLRTSVLGRHDPVSERKSDPLACAQAQGRRRAVRAPTHGILHKVGCSWSARPEVDCAKGSAGPTTPPRFEPFAQSTSGRQTGEPTVSHEGCSGLRLSFRFVDLTLDLVLEEESSSLACAQAQGRRRAVRAPTHGNLHKVGCSWPARAPGVLPTGSAGPTTPPRFEPMGNTPGARPAGEPTVSHEGCSGIDSSSAFHSAVTDG